MSLPSDPCRPYESNEEPKAGDGRSSGSVSHTSSRPPHPIVFENQTGYKTPYSSRPPDDLGKSSIASDPSNVPMDQSALGGMSDTDLDEQRWQAFLEQKRKKDRVNSQNYRDRQRAKRDAERRAELGQQLATSSTATLDPNTSTSQGRDHFSGQLPPFSDFLSTVSNPNATLPEPPGRKK
ncbi:hypothetical protein L204_105997 [Cryptococcus depauperatus]